MVLWAVALYELATRRTMLLAGGLFCVPLLGLFVDRGYWGLIAVPFVVWRGADAVVELVSRYRMVPEEVPVLSA